MEVLFATSNRNKVAEAAAVLKACGVSVKHLPFEHREIRSDSLEEIAREADFDWVMADVEDATAEEMYNGEDGGDDAPLVEEFKREDRYAE